MPPVGDDVQFEPDASTGQQPNYGEGRKYEEVTVKEIRPKLKDPETIQGLRNRHEAKYGYLDSWALECLYDMENDAENPEIPSDDSESAGEEAGDSSMQASNEQAKTARTSKQAKKKTQAKVIISKAEEVKDFQGYKPLETILKEIGDKSSDEQTPGRKKKWQPPKDALQNESDEEEEDKEKEKEPPSSEAIADTSDNYNKVIPEIQTPELPQPEPTPDVDDILRDRHKVRSVHFRKVKTVPSREIQPNHSYSAALQPGRELGQRDGEEKESPEEKNLQGSQKLEADSTAQNCPEVNKSDQKVENPEDQGKQSPDEKDLGSSQKLEAQNGPEVDVQDKNNENPQAQGDGDDNQSPEKKEFEGSQKVEAVSTSQIGPEVNESDHKVENPEDQVKVLEADKVLKQDPNYNESGVEEDNQSQKKDSDQSDGDDISEDEETELPLPTNVLARTSGTRQRQELKVMPPKDDENQVPAMPPPMGRHEKDRNEAQGHGVSKSKTLPKRKTEQACAKSGNEPSEDEDSRESSGNNRPKIKTLMKRKTVQPPAQFGDEFSDRRERQQNANNRPKSKSPPKGETKEGHSQSRDEPEEEGEPQDQYEEDQVNDEHSNLNKRKDGRWKDSNGDESNSDTRGSRKQNGFMIKIAFEIEISAPGMEISFSKSSSN
ncbi:Hypothetical predicted protein [Cloeon dipterum]|uniref:Uncharacterized protein n=1 Tax=Cloeon dipterum TaxID=197152 RepID=A0A8S1CWN9_9INSE|nr:Hypothetical predicted protein [Cloeon dipterum]